MSKEKDLGPMKNEVLNIDPMQMMEDIGIDPKENLGAAIGLMHMVHNVQKEIHKERNDTYFSMPWGEFKSLIESHGFIIGYQERFLYDNDRQPEEIIAYHPKFYLVIHATSWISTDDETINSGILHCLITGDGKKIMTLPHLSGGMISHLDYTHQEFLNHPTRYDLEDGRYIYHIYFDIREGFVTHLMNIQFAGETIPWDRSPGLVHMNNYGPEEKIVDSKYPFVETYETAIRKIRKIKEMEKITPIYFKDDALEQCLLKIRR